MVTFIFRKSLYPITKNKGVSFTEARWVRFYIAESRGISIHGPMIIRLFIGIDEYPYKS